jgi:dephospho-CoA kinase
MMPVIDMSTLFIGFTGSPGSGCTYFAESISSLAPKYKYYRLSDFIRGELEKEGKYNPSVSDLQDKGNDMRASKGANVLVDMLLDKVDSDFKGRRKKPFGIIVDGIKNTAEIQLLRMFTNFFLVTVQARTETRKQRLIDNGKFISEQEFDVADQRDKSEQYEYGQQVSKCSYLADVAINNDANVAIVEKANAVKKIYDHYITLIEYFVEGKSVIDVKPTVDELCMTIAYSLSKNSSCLKRKVGAVVVDIDQTQEI